MEEEAYFSVIAKTTRSVSVSAEQCIQGEATPTPQLRMSIWTMYSLRIIIDKSTETATQCSRRFRMESSTSKSIQKGMED